MLGEQNLDKMLKGLKLDLSDQIFVFVTVETLANIQLNEVFAIVNEVEAYTLVLSKEKADQLDLPYHYQAAKISIQVHSALEAVGLTAALSTQLAKVQMSCNVIAGYYHDHLFVDYHQREKAIDALLELRSKT